MKNKFQRQELFALNKNFLLEISNFCTKNKTKIRSQKKFSLEKNSCLQKIISHKKFRTH